MTQYLDQKTYRNQKAALTRAQNSGDPVKVLNVIQKALREWEGVAWPDDWHRWNIALGDAVSELHGWRAGLGVHLDDTSDEWFDRATGRQSTLFGRAAL